MSHFYFSNGRGLNVTQSFANVTHGDSGRDTFFLKVSRDPLFQSHKGDRVSDISDF